MALLVLLCLLGHVWNLQVSAAPVNNAFKHLQSAAKFWHISDLHLDPTYHITEDHTKVCFSSKGVPALDPGVFGDFLCDSPYQLILSAFSYMKQADLQPDQLPTSANAIYDAVAKLWSPWLNPEAVATLQKGGFYSLVIKPGLRLVSLNTNLYYSPNQVTVNMTDPAGQFQWLQETLELSRQKLEKVYVIAHVPIGYLPYAINTTAVRESYNERLVKIFRYYSDVVQGQFYGHTHRDSIMVLLDQQGKPVNSIFVTPAVTPIKSLLEPYSNNPGVRAYLYHPENYGLLDIWQFYLNLTEANLEQKSDWKLEYIMTEAFNIDDIQPHNLHELALRFEQPQSKDFDKYFNHFMVSYNFSLTCEGLCKTIQVCAVHFLDQETYSQCIAKAGI
ncbi:cyclic GMP-AMP phosphodiesterase SMPDL3A [Sinocyclocheilus grahami]|uniref:cyclic GMP-AMP phosphodiesterase SMPDL3A n=1 Tax=Sinocyclocheilus grahami TaxID=75366 RepID=UPI0007AD34F2|nr:PREDICTED: acid sphingomyelinase-like phosphodiesterase 3a [Sinocyclocheilus grahami]